MGKIIGDDQIGEAEAMKISFRVALALLAAGTMFAQAPKANNPPLTSIVGYLRDSGCVHRFREVVKPLRNGCALRHVSGQAHLWSF
jgi:hypothetical protein